MELTVVLLVDKWVVAFVTPFIDFCRMLGDLRRLSGTRLDDCFYKSQKQQQKCKGKIT